MNYLTPVSRRRNARAFIAAFITYVMLAGQVAPLALAARAPSSKPVSQPVVAETTPAAPANLAAPVPQPLFFAPGITATKVDSFPDPNGNNKAEPGDRITYTVTITNNGVNSPADDALNVQFNDSVDINTSLVPGSTTVTPLANNDSFTSTGNIGNLRAAPGVLANDTDPDGGTLTVTQVQSTPVPGGGSATADTNTAGRGGVKGSVTMNSDGGFTYEPPPGFTGGTDTFDYTASDGALTNTGTVTINISGIAWFIRNGGGGANTGTFSNPFTAIAAFNTANAAGGALDPKDGDFISLRTGTYAGVDGINLRATQKLIGEAARFDTFFTADAESITAYETFAAGTQPAPVITTTAGNGIDLNTGNLVRGLNVGNVAGGAKIFGNGFGTLTIGNNTTPDVALSGTGQALNLTNGTFSATSGFGGVATTSSPTQGIILTGVGSAGPVGFGGTAVSGATTQGILIGTTTADISFGNTTVSAATDAISFQNNSGGTRTFGTLTATGGTGGAFIHGAGGGNVTVNNAASLTSGAATTVDILNQGAGTTINFAGGATLTKTAAGGTGVNLTTANGNVTFSSLTIGTSGVRFPSSAVTITNGGTAAVYSLGAVSIFTNGLAGITATDADGTLNVASGTIDVNAATAININGPAGLTTLGMTLGTVNSTGGTNNVTLTDAGGSLAIQGGALSGATGAAFAATNTSATVNCAAPITNTTGGVALTNNTGGTFNFTGGLNLSTGANPAFTATGGGTVTATQNNTSIVNTLTTTTGTALNVANTNIGANGLTFRSINSTTSSANNGVILNTTGTTAGTHGGLTITGNGGTCTSAATCTGGNIANKTGADASTTQGTGIFLNSTRDVSLTNVFLNDFQNFAIYGSSVTNFTFTTSRVSGTNGTSSNPTNEGCIRFDGLLGNALITGSNIGNTNTATGATNALHVNNASGTLTLLDIQNSTIFNQNASAVPANSGQDAIFFGSPSGATGAMNLRLNNSNLTHARQFLLQVNIQGTKTANIEVTNNQFVNQHSAVVSAGGGSNLTGGGTDVYVKYLISGNTFRQTGANNSGRAMTIGHASGNAAFDGKFLNNTIGATGVAKSGAGDAADGLGIFASGNNSPTMGGSKALVQGNTIQRYGEAGILVNARQGSSTLDVTIIGNIIREPGTAALGAFAAIWVNSGALAADTNIVNVVIGSATIAANKNTMTNADPSNATDVFLDKNTCAGCASQLRLFQNGSDAAGATTEDKVRDVLNDDNIGPLDLLAGFTNASAITLVAAGLPVQPSLVGNFEEGGKKSRFPVGTPSAPTSRPDSSEGQIETPGAANSVMDAPAASASDTELPSLSGRVNEIVPATRTMPAAKPLSMRKTKGGTTLQHSAADSSAPLNVEPLSLTQRQKSPRAPISKSGPTTGNGTGGTVSINIGTLRAGESVTITFQVDVDNPYNGPANVSNQGTVSGTNFSNVLTDDAGGGAADPTLTPINSTNIFVRDAKVAEPATGTTNMVFTVTLSQPATSSVQVNFTTADEAPGPGKAVSGTCPGSDYTTTSGTVGFAVGQQVQAISVPICSDANAEPDETFLLNLTGATGGTILDNQAVGTITQNTPGTFLISELRTSGPNPNGSTNEFVELYNNTDAPVTVADGTGIIDAAHGFGVFKMGADCGATPILIGVVPNGTVIPARGHYLMTGAGYGLTGYAASNLPLLSDIENDRNIAVFSTANITLISSAVRLDGVGFGLNIGGLCDLFREGTTQPPVSGSTLEYTFFRKECDFVAGVGCTTPGNPKDVNDNSVDFAFADTQGMPIAGVQQRLGAPGPENLASPIRRDATGAISGTLLDTTKAASADPNRFRNFTPGSPNTSSQGTLSIRRRFKNNTGAAVTRLRFRIVEVTTFPSTGLADLRAIDSTSVSVLNVNDGTTCAANGVPPTAPCTVTVQGTTLEQPPNQTLGGGYNATLAAGTVTLGTPLANNASISLQFLMGVQTPGTFRLLIIVEALP
jgi:hypothetical protein